MASKRIREAVRRIVEQEIDEMTGTAGVSGFGTPYAFSTKEPVSSKKKKRVNESRFELIDDTDLPNGKVRVKIKDKKTGEVVVNKVYDDSGDAEYDIKFYMYQESINERGPWSGRAGTITQSSNGKKWIGVNPKGTEKAVLRNRDQAIEFSKTGMIGGNPNWDRRGEYTFPVNEGGDPYYAWRNDETATPRMKIGKVISEINKQLREMERVVRRTSRLKKEMGLPNSGLWQRTNNALMKMESRMHRISQTIRNMRG